MKEKLSETRAEIKNALTWTERKFSPFHLCNIVLNQVLKYTSLRPFQYGVWL